MPEESAAAKAMKDKEANAALPIETDPLLEALSSDLQPLGMALASAVQAGRDAYLSGAMTEQHAAQASTPVLGTPFWHQT